MPKEICWKVDKVGGQVSSRMNSKVQPGDVVYMSEVVDGLPGVTMGFYAGPDHDHRLPSVTVHHAIVELVSDGVIVYGFVHKGTGESYHLLDFYLVQAD